MTVDSGKGRRAYMQQWTVDQIKGKKSEPREDIMRDLLAFMIPWKRQKYKIVLMIGANESLQEWQGSIAKLAARLELSSAHVDLRTEQIATHSEGKKQIDYMLVSKGIRMNIVQKGLEPFYDRIISDPRGVFIDIDCTSLIRGEIQELDNVNTRTSSTIQPKKIRKYKEIILRGMKENRLTERVHALSNVKNLTKKEHKEMEKIDNVQTELMNKATRKAQRPTPQWSAKLKQAVILVIYLKIHLENFRGKYHMIEQIWKIAKGMEVKQIPPINVTECNGRLRRAQIARR